MIDQNIFGKQLAWTKLGVASALVLSLAACGGHKSSDASQVLAKVDGSEITIHQLNNEMRDLPAEKAGDKKALLTSLVDRTLLVEAAQTAKLDQTPGVLQEMERAKSQILARAYLQSRIQNAAPPSADEISAFYRDNPDLFAQRKTYTFEELIVNRLDFPADAQASMKDVLTLEQAAAWLDSKNIKYQRGTLTRSAADLTPGVVKALKQSESDVSHLVVVVEQNAVAILKIAKVQQTPVAEADAAPQIQRYLANRSSAQKVQAEVAQLRSKAKIEYMNEKLIGGSVADTSQQSSVMPANAASAPATQPPAASPAAPAQPSIPAEDGGNTVSPKSAEHIDRGAAGLR